MLVDKFLLNTDYDTQKERNSYKLTITNDPFTLTTEYPGKMKGFQITSENIGSSSFEIVSLTSTHFPNLGMVGDDTVYDNGEVEFSFYVAKLHTGEYHFEVRVINYSNHNVDIPAGSFTANIHQFVPSSQE